MRERMKIAKKSIFLGGLVISIAYVIPFVLVFINAFKPKMEILMNPLALPKTFMLDNFTQALEKMDFYRSLTNSVIITVVSVSGLIIFSSMLAYYLARNKNRFTKTTFLILVASMIVPFQALMIPFIAIFAQFVALNNRAALIFFYQGFGIALSVFLYHGFISKIPMDLDEAAAMDGASDMTIFWKIMFPMLRPVTATVAIVNALWIWNDFLLPRLVLTRETQTLPLSTYLFYGQYTSEYGQAMAGLLLAVVPIIAFYLILQKQFIAGISQGAVK
ncbi:UgpE ABC-type sugar transport system, permease component [Candidatus Nanopelagicaceae bacterium]